MDEYKPSPEFEEKVREALAAPAAKPEFVNQLRSELARRPVKMKPRFVMRPAWVIAFILVAVVLALNVPGVAAALKQVFGYVPDVGLVENSDGMRVLEEPVSVTREGVTLTVTQALVYADHVQLVYEVGGIAPENDGTKAADANDNQAAFCGPASSFDGNYLSDGDAALRLPDGTVVKRVFGSSEYPENVFAMKPAYKVSVPADVTELTMVLKCIPWARLDAVPENWEVPFKLVSVPEGMVVGAPVTDVNATSEPIATDVVPPTASSQSPQVTFTLERVAQADTGPVFYIRLHVENPDPSMVTIFPRNVYVLDSLGQKIQLMNNTSYSEDPSTVWELIPATKPADGELTLIVEDAVAKFAPPNETTFTFDAGENPQPGQIWELNKEFDIADYRTEVTSVRAATYSDIEVNPECWDPQTNSLCRSPYGSQGFDYGYQFTFKLDPTSGVSNVAMDILSTSPGSCGISDVRPMAPSTSIYYTQLCRDGYPKGNVKVILRNISVLVKNVGQVVWSPDGATTPLKSVSVPPASISSESKVPNATATLERVVKLGDSYIFYIQMTPREQRPNFLGIMPGTVYVIDSSGQKIALRLKAPYSPYLNEEGLWEYQTMVKIAHGPIRIVVEKAKVFYTAMDRRVTWPTQQMIEDQSFTFDVGSSPQLGQTWAINKEFEISGYKLKVISARAVSWKEYDPSYVGSNVTDRQGYETGYEFTMQSADPAIQMEASFQPLKGQNPLCGLGDFAMQKGSTFTFISFCKGALPNNSLRATFQDISVLIDDVWQMDWTPSAP